MSHSYTPPPLPHSFRLACLLALLSAVIVVLTTAVALVAVALTVVIVFPPPRNVDPDCLVRKLFVFFTELGGVQDGYEWVTRRKVLYYLHMCSLR